MRFKISSWPGKVTARKVTAVGVPILLIALVIANSYPFTLNLFGSVERSAQVPSYYYEAASWIGSQGTDFRIMTLPQEANGVAYYSWNPGYLMVPVERTLFQASVLDSLLTPFFADHDFGQYIYNTIITNRTTYAGRLLSSFGVKYIMVPNDRFYESSFPSHQMWNISSVTAILNEQKDLVVVQRFGELSFYENLDFARSLAYGTYNYYTLPANTSLEAYKLWSTSENSTSQLQAFLAQDSGVPLEVTRNAIDLSGYVSTVRHPLNLTQSIHGWISFHLSNLWLNSLDGLNGTSSIDGVGNSTGETPPAEVAYCYCGAYANWSQSDMLGFWMKGPRAFSFDVLVRDFQNRVDQWNFEYTKPDSWSFFQANLDSSTTGDQSIDLSRVNMISFQIPGFQSSFGITAISLAKFSVSSPQQLKAVSPPPDLRFVRVSPTEIRVTALSVNPFVLVLSESFDQDWSATVNGAVLTHFVTNFYANGWYVPMSGTMEISIRFTVQQYVEVGAAISSLGILGILLVSMLRLKCERARTHRIRRK